MNIEQMHVGIGSKTGDLTKLSDDEFLHLLKEASTFNKPNNEESILLKRLRKEIGDGETRDNTQLVEVGFPLEESNKPSEITVCNDSNAFCRTHNSCHRSQQKSCERLMKDEEFGHSGMLDNILHFNAQHSQSLHNFLSSDSLQMRADAKKTSQTSSSKNSSLYMLKNRTEKYPTELSSVESTLSDGDIFEQSLNDNFLHTQENTKSPLQIAESENVQCKVFSNESNYDVENLNAFLEEKNVPFEIEMKEINSNKSIAKSADNSMRKEVEKPELQDRKSQFYIDCSDVETTVSFPLKLLSHIDKGSSTGVNDGAKDYLKNQMAFPLGSWARSLQVQSFFNSLPLSKESYVSQGGNHFYSDINGNSFSQVACTTSLTSYVSSTFLNYSSSNLTPENKNRKNKRLKNAVNQGILSENIAGHRGEDDIESLLKYINSSEEKGKTVKGNATNHGSIFQEQEKKKSCSKDNKNYQNKTLLKSKMKFSKSNSVENLTSSHIELLSLEGNVMVSESDKKMMSIHNSGLTNANIIKYVNEINGIEIESEQMPSLSKEASNRLSCSIPSEVSKVSADLCVNINSSLETEETGFLMVKKKNRKKYQRARSDSYRWHGAQVQRKKSMLSLSQNKQDFHRKSISSVPHSEHSSADNSDLDSVHSLPVRGSKPHPLQSYPHTLPSSSSSTPQASYADIARLPTSKSNRQHISPTFDQEINRNIDACFLNIKNGSNLNDHIAAMSDEIPSETVTDKSTKICESKIIPFPSFKKGTNTQKELEANSLEANLSQKNMYKIGKKDCLDSENHENHSFKSEKSKSKISGIPPVIMDYIPFEPTMCDISFGFGVKELLDLPSGDTIGSSEVKNYLSSNAISISSHHTESACKTSDLALEKCSHNITNSYIKPSVHFRNSRAILESASQCKAVLYDTGKTIYYFETGMKLKFNYVEIVSHCESAFHAVERELAGAYANKDGKVTVKYYTDS